MAGAFFAREAKDCGEVWPARRSLPAPKATGRSLEARGVEPLFPSILSMEISQDLPILSSK
jgi:hypothetical protein